jgi:hypothetical protein
MGSTKAPRTPATRQRSITGDLHPHRRPLTIPRAPGDIGGNLCDPPATYPDAMPSMDRATVHVALLGDSIFDNGAYANGMPDVVTHLRERLPVGGRASLLAADGSTTSDVADIQVANLPDQVTHVAVSMGGNDALLNAEALDLPIHSTRDALSLFGLRAAAFETSYRRALAAILDRVPRTAVCTIYNPNLTVEEATLTRVGLMMFNDVILRAAVERGVPVIDLRLVIVDPDDYANPLEPSSRGGEKIARSIAAALGLTDSTGAVSHIFGPVAGP